MPIKQASSHVGDWGAGNSGRAGGQHQGSASTGRPSWVSKLPGRTREDKGSRLTLSPAAPPGWMHSIQSPGGQITQTPVSVAHQLRAACGMRGVRQPWGCCGISTAPGLGGSQLKEAGIKAGSRRIQGIVGEKGRSGNPAPSPSPLLFLGLRQGPGHQKQWPLTSQAGEGTSTRCSLQAGMGLPFLGSIWQC